MLTTDQRDLLSNCVSYPGTVKWCDVIEDAVDAALAEIDAARTTIARLARDNADQAMILHDLQQDVREQTEAGKESERAAILEMLNRQRAPHQVDLNVQPHGGADWHFHAGADAALEVLGKEIIYRSGSGNPLILPLDAMLERQRALENTLRDLLHDLRQRATPSTEDIAAATALLEAGQGTSG